MLKSTVKLIRKTIIAVVGFAVVILGIILIPLPGPGLLVIIGGLFILSWEFEWAERHYSKLKAKFEELKQKLQEQKNKRDKNT